MIGRVPGLIAVAVPLFIGSLALSEKSQDPHSTNGLSSATEGDSSQHKIDPALIQASASSEVSSHTSTEASAKARARAAAQVRWRFGGNF